MEDKINIAAKEVTQKILDLPVGSEFVTGEFIKEYQFSQKDNFALFKEILSLCESNNIDISNMQSGQILGLPWVYKYRKNN